MLSNPVELMNLKLKYRSERKSLEFDRADTLIESVTEAFENHALDPKPEASIEEWTETAVLKTFNSELKSWYSRFEKEKAV